MKTIQVKLRAILLMLIVTAATQAQPRYFDWATSSPDTQVIAICYPTMYSLRSVLALQREGFLPTEKFLVVGVYYEKESSDYQSARRYVDINGLKKNFRFHEVRGELNPQNIYRENGCSGEFALIFHKSQGIIFFGGADIPPELYGDKTSLLTELRTPYRHYFELSFIFHLLGGYQNGEVEPLLEERTAYPVLGICLGEQSLNVGTGGTLIQDIWDEVYDKENVEDVLRLGKERWHNNPWIRLRPLDGLLHYNMHRIRLKEDGTLVQELALPPEATPYVVSSHHQAVKKLGKDLRVIATSLDGKVVEAVAHQRYPNVLGVQFHPEFSILYDREKKVRIRPDDEPFTLRSVLENNPPSYLFHQRLWAWFLGRVEGQSR